MNKYFIRRYLNSFSDHFNHPKVFQFLIKNFSVIKNSRIDDQKIVLDNIIPHGIKLWYFINSDIGFNGLYLFGQFEPEEIKLIKKIIRPGDTFVDVGANIGYHTVIAAKTVGPKGQVHAIEPFSSNVNLIKKNIIANNLSNVQVHPIVTGHQNKTVMLNAYSDYAYNSLYKLDRQTFYNQIKVPMKKIDTLVENLHIKNIKLIKIDVEGAELRVLQGARETLVSQKPDIICEIEDSNLTTQRHTVKSVIKYIYSLGYHGYQIKPHKLIPINQIKNQYQSRDFYFKFK